MMGLSPKLPVILQTEVAFLASTTRLTFEDVDDLVIENDADVVTGGDDFVGVPFANFHVGVDAGLDVINGTCFVFVRFVSADLDFVSLFDGDPGVVAGIGEADEDA